MKSKFKLIICTVLNVAMCMVFMRNKNLKEINRKLICAVIFTALLVQSITNISIAHGYMASNNKKQVYFDSNISTFTKSSKMMFNTNGIYSDLNINQYKAPFANIRFSNANLKYSGDDISEVENVSDISPAYYDDKKIDSIPEQDWKIYNSIDDSQPTIDHKNLYADLENKQVEITVKNPELNQDKKSVETFALATDTQCYSFYQNKWVDRSFKVVQVLTTYGYEITTIDMKAFRDQDKTIGLIQGKFNNAGVPIPTAVSTNSVTDYAADNNAVWRNYGTNITGTTNYGAECSKILSPGEKFTFTPTILSHSFDVISQKFSTNKLDACKDVYNGIIHCSNQVEGNINLDLTITDPDFEPANSGEQVNQVRCFPKNQSNNRYGSIVFNKGESVNCSVDFNSPYLDDNKILYFALFNKQKGDVGQIVDTSGLIKLSDFDPSAVNADSDDLITDSSKVAKVNLWGRGTSNNRSSVSFELEAPQIEGGFFATSYILDKSVTDNPEEAYKNLLKSCEKFSDENSCAHKSTNIYVSAPYDPYNYEINPEGPINIDCDFVNHNDGTFEFPNVVTDENDEPLFGGGYCSLFTRKSENFSYGDITGTVELVTKDSNNKDTIINQMSSNVFHSNAISFNDSGISNINLSSENGDVSKTHEVIPMEIDPTLIKSNDFYIKLNFKVTVIGDDTGICVGHNDLTNQKNACIAKYGTDSWQPGKGVVNCAKYYKSNISDFTVKYTNDNRSAYRKSILSNIKTELPSQLYIDGSDSITCKYDQADLQKYMQLSEDFVIGCNMKNKEDNVRIGIDVWHNNGEKDKSNESIHHDSYAYNMIDGDGDRYSASIPNDDDYNDDENSFHSMKLYSFADRKMFGFDFLIHLPNVSYCERGACDPETDISPWTIKVKQYKIEGKSVTKVGNDSGLKFSTVINDKAYKDEKYINNHFFKESVENVLQLEKDKVGRYFNSNKIMTKYMADSVDESEFFDLSYQILSSQEEDSQINERIIRDASNIFVSNNGTGYYLDSLGPDLLKNDLDNQINLLKSYCNDTLSFLGANNNCNYSKIVEKLSNKDFLSSASGSNITTVFTSVVPYVVDDMNNLERIAKYFSKRTYGDFEKFLVVLFASIGNDPSNRETLALRNLFFKNLSLMYQTLVKIEYYQFAMQTAVGDYRTVSKFVCVKMDKEDYQNLSLPEPISEYYDNMYAKGKNKVAFLTSSNTQCVKLKLKLFKYFTALVVFNSLYGENKELSELIDFSTLSDFSKIAEEDNNSNADFGVKNLYFGKSAIEWSISGYLKISFENAKSQVSSVLNSYKEILKDKLPQNIICYVDYDQCIGQKRNYITYDDLKDLKFSLSEHLDVWDQIELLFVNEISVENDPQEIWTDVKIHCLNHNEEIKEDSGYVLDCEISRTEAKTKLELNVQIKPTQGEIQFSKVTLDIGETDMKFTLTIGSSDRLDSKQTANGEIRISFEDRNDNSIYSLVVDHILYSCSYVKDNKTAAKRCDLS